MTQVKTGSANYEQNIDKMYGNQQRGRSDGGYGGREDGGGRGSGGGRGNGSSGSSGGSMSQFDSHINSMYDSYLEGQKATLQSGYETNVSNLDAEKENARKETDTNLTRTYVEAAKKAKNYNEVQNAYGLTSGAMGQAQLASGNQLAGDLTGIRNQGADAMAEIERQRSILAKEYAAAIAKAQADNDFQRAQALYEAAQKEQDRLQQIKLLQMQFEQQVKMFEMQQAAQAAAAGGGYGGYSYSSGSGGVTAPVAESTAPTKPLTIQDVTSAPSASSTGGGLKRVMLTK
jgi:hypothetical protein